MSLLRSVPQTQYNQFVYFSSLKLITAVETQWLRSSSETKKTKCPPLSEWRKAQTSQDTIRTAYIRFSSQSFSLVLLPKYESFHKYLCCWKTQTGCHCVINTELSPTGAGLGPCTHCGLLCNHPAMCFQLLTTTSSVCFHWYWALVPWIELRGGGGGGGGLISAHWSRIRLWGAMLFGVFLQT